MLSEPIAVVVRVAQAFDALGIRHFVAGSLASSVYGTPRATQDVDLVAELNVDDAARIDEALASEFYIDEAMIRDAVVRGGSFNLIHLASMFKIDVFAMGQDGWSRAELSRARAEVLAGPHGPTSVMFASPEDVLLHKLVWYRLGKEVSDRQWSDVLGMLKVQGDGLDDGYLDQWATPLGVADLLERARGQSSR